MGYDASAAEQAFYALGDVPWKDRRECIVCLREHRGDVTKPRTFGRINEQCPRDHWIKGYGRSPKYRYTGLPDETKLRLYTSSGYKGAKTVKGKCAWPDRKRRRLLA